MIIEYVTQNPGQMEQYTDEYKGYLKRTVVFLDDWATAQFFEVNGKLIEHWNEGDTFTSNAGENYASMNVSLVPRKFIVIYHNDKNVIAEVADKQVKYDFGSSDTSGIIKFNSESGNYEREL